MSLEKGGGGAKGGCRLLPTMPCLRPLCFVGSLDLAARAIAPLRSTGLRRLGRGVIPWRGVAR